MRLFTVFVAIIMLLVMISLVPTTRELPYLPPIAIIAIGGLTAYLLWNVTRSAHRKMAEILSKGIMEEQK
jgi:4-amino-4-deoxy-L-arabinose transferase-like glycosyltransferase